MVLSLAGGCGAADPRRCSSACGGAFAAALPRSSCSTAAGTPLPFSLEECAPSPLPSCETEVEYDPLLELASIRAACTPSSEAAKQLAAAVAACRPAPRGPDDAALWRLACELRARRGYAVALRTTGGKQPAAYLRLLRHSFLVVRCGAGGGAGGGGGGGASTELFVDPSFRDAFRQAKSRPWYDTLLDALPQDFVGDADSLARVAHVMASAARQLFRQLGLPLPPWREPCAVVARWAPAAGDGYEDLEVPLVQAQEQVRTTPFAPAPAQATAPGALAPASCFLPAGRLAPGLVAAPGPAGRLQPALALRTGSARCTRVDDDAVPHLVVFGFPDDHQQQQQERRLRRSSAPATVIAAAAASASGRSSPLAGAAGPFACYSAHERGSSGGGAAGVGGDPSLAPPVRGGAKATAAALLGGRTMSQSLPGTGAEGGSLGWGPSDPRPPQTRPSAAWQGPGEGSEPSDCGSGAEAAAGAEAAVPAGLVEPAPAAEQVWPLQQPQAGRQPLARQQPHPSLPQQPPLQPQPQPRVQTQAQAWQQQQALQPQQPKQAAHAGRRAFRALDDLLPKVFTIRLRGAT